MYKVLIVDDEKNIREGIIELIDWEELDCRVCAALPNGRQVLKYLEEQETADLVITDIKMPVMDGMELAEELYDRYPDIRVIILTAYSDFAYARQAIKYQVADFVIKNEFLAELPRAVKKVVKRWKAEGRGYTQEKPEYVFSEEEIVYVCACDIKDRDRMDLRSHRENLENLLAGVFPERRTTLLDDGDGMMMLIECKGNSEDPGWMKRRLEKFVSLARNFQGIHFRIGCSSPVKSSECMQGGRKHALRNLSNVYTDDAPVNVREKKEEQIRYWPDDGDLDNYMRSLYIALRSGEKAEQERMEKEFAEYLKKEEYPIEQCRSDTHAVISYLLRKMRNALQEEKALAPESVLDAVYRSRSKAALGDIMKDACTVLASYLSGDGNNRSTLVRNVDRIIEKCYQEKISLKYISHELYVNSSYLSRIYKKETGVTVTDAINAYRIKRAKELMNSGNYKVYEVGKMVGIEDPAYFTHVFLKYEGMNPTDYMSRKE